jgi:AcrR family transcriptional regulator
MDTLTRKPRASTKNSPRPNRPTRNSAGASREATESARLSRQAEKSLQTRQAILEATITCFVQLGYFNTTMEKIAQYAKVSRGAMMHHFASRADVIEKAAVYLAEKRLAEFEKLANSIIDPLPKGEDPQLIHMQQAVELNHRFYSLPSFEAGHELLLAARTDKKLAKVVRQSQKTVNDGIPRIILRLYPAWAKKSDVMLLMADLVHFTFRGVAMSHMDDLEPERLANLRQALGQIAYDGYCAAR